jgi:hypothetical protein
MHIFSQVIELLKRYLASVSTRIHCVEQDVRSQSDILNNHEPTHSWYKSQPHATAPSFK